MLNKSREIVIVGDGEFAAIAHEYFMHDSPYEVAGFAVERNYWKKKKFQKLPVVPLERLGVVFPSKHYRVFVAVTHTQLNRLRERLSGLVRRKGYELVSHVSSRAFVSPSAQLGEGCFIYENCSVGPHAKIGRGVICCSGTQVAHRARVGDYAFLAAGTVVGGYSRIGERTFLGLHSTVSDVILVGSDCVIGAGAVVLKNTKAGRIYRGNPAVNTGVESRDFYRFKEIK